MGDWVKVSDQLPPEETVVETKIDDSKGCRNVQRLKRRGRLWFFPDGSMYVYYGLRIGGKISGLSFGEVRKK